MGCFLDLKTEFWLLDTPERLVHNYTGDIRDEISLQKMGEISAWTVDSEAMLDIDHSLYDVLDIDGETAEFSALLSSNDLHLYSKSVLRLLAGRRPAYTGMIMVTRLEIAPQFRGKQLGLAALYCLHQALGNRFGIMALNPDPFQYHPIREEEAPASDFSAQMQVGSHSGSVASGRKRISKYFGQMGFRRVPRTKLMVLDLSDIPPDEFFIDIEC